MDILRNIGPTEIIIILIILLVLFGGGKVKELARGMGEATKELKKARDEIEQKPDPNHKKTKS